MSLLHGLSLTYPPRHDTLWSQGMIAPVWTSFSHFKLTCGQPQGLGVAIPLSPQLQVLYVKFWRNNHGSTYLLRYLIRLFAICKWTCTCIIYIYTYTIIDIHLCTNDLLFCRVSRLVRTPTAPKKDPCCQLTPIRMRQDARLPLACSVSLAQISSCHRKRSFGHS